MSVVCVWHAAPRLQYRIPADGGSQSPGRLPVCFRFGRPAAGGVLPPPTGTWRRRIRPSLRVAAPRAAETHALGSGQSPSRQAGRQAGTVCVRHAAPRLRYRIPADGGHIAQGVSLWLPFWPARRRGGFTPPTGAWRRRIRPSLRVAAPRAAETHALGSGQSPSRQPLFALGMQPHGSSTEYRPMGAHIAQGVSLCASVLAGPPQGGITPPTGAWRRRIRPSLRVAAPRAAETHALGSGQSPSRQAGRQAGRHCLR